MSEKTETCPRCEQPHGTCQHTAPAIEVGDTIDVHQMSPGQWDRVNEMRPHSVVVDRDGDWWTRACSSHRWWESEDGQRMDIRDIAHAWGPATVEHVAERRAAR